MRTRRIASRPMLISFSGIDGAGKSTQIQALHARMRDAGLRVRLIAFWDDIAWLKSVRESAGHRIFKGDKGVGTPSAPINRRDKNVRSWFMTGVRLGIYALDAMATRAAVQGAFRADADVILFDRFIYDELANLALRNPAMQIYARLLAGLVPKPHISYLLDADPAQARARKPEYPLEFLHANRNSYLILSELIGGITVIAPMPVEDAEREILKHVLRELALRDHLENRGYASFSEKGCQGAQLDGSRSIPPHFASSPPKLGDPR